jgi:hypothetical protein
MTPTQIALDALTRLGEQPGPDPVTQIRAIADQAFTQLDHTKVVDLGHSPHLSPQAAAYEQLLDRATTAAVAVARILQAQQRTAPLLHAANLLEAEYAAEAAQLHDTPHGATDDDPKKWSD